MRVNVNPMSRHQKRVKRIQVNTAIIGRVECIRRTAASSPESKTNLFDQTLDMFLLSDHQCHGIIFERT